MFLHHTMTDSEILRTCEGCESTHLRLVSDRLRDRVQDLREIHKLAYRIEQSFELRDIQQFARRIVKLSEVK